MLHFLLDLMNPVTELGQPRVIRHDASFPSSTALHGFPLVAAASRPCEDFGTLAGGVGTADLDIYHRIAATFAMVRWRPDGVSVSVRSSPGREPLRPNCLCHLDLAGGGYSHFPIFQLG